MNCCYNNNSSCEFRYINKDELVYNSTEITDELDDSVIENLFESDWKLEFEGFVV